jgi:hypothetical protein
VSPIGGKVGDVGNLRVEISSKLIAYRTPQSELTLIPESLSVASAGSRVAQIGGKTNLFKSEKGRVKIYIIFETH